MKDSTTRFSSRVANYIKYRPGYPVEITALLNRECRLTSASVVADIGSGTGILTRLFLRNGNVVHAVEPNREMREAAEGLLGDDPKFRSVDATAEDTKLAPNSVDFIVAGQAFHWFDRERARREFCRILKPGGWVALIWNERRTDSSPFLKGYEECLRMWSVDYSAVDHKQIDAGVIGAFFAPDTFKLAKFANRQVFDFEGLKGRLLSSSYAPEPGHPRHEPMLRELSALFHDHQQRGEVAFDYDTLVYHGRRTSGER
jgi:SAM-dependent methyltransferase